MAYSLLELISQASNEMGLTAPSAVIGSSVNQTKQLLALTQRLGKDLVREFEWQRLIKRWVFTTSTPYTKTGNTTSASTAVTGMSDTDDIQVGDIVSGTGIRAHTEIYSIDSSTEITLTQPASAAGTGTTLTFTRQDNVLLSDVNRLINDAQWDRTNYWPNQGSLNSQQWQSMLGSVATIGPRLRFQIFNNQLRLFPAPTTPTIISLDYVSNYWVMATGSTTPTKATATADTDTFVYHDDLMLAGLKYYFRKEKRLDFGIDLAEFNDILSTRKAQDVPLQNLSMAPQPTPWLIGAHSVSDGSWDLGQ